MAYQESHTEKTLLPSQASSLPTNLVKSDPMLPDVTGSIHLGIGFLHNSPIRNPDGSVNAAYTEGKGKYHAVYHEITGYAIATAWICREFLRTEDSVWIARDAARYFTRLRLMGKQREGAFPHAYQPRGRPRQDCYFSFDNGIILQNLAVHLGRIPEDSELAMLEECADWLVDRMQNSDGSFNSFLDAEGRHRPESGALFYHDKGCLHAKLAIGLLRMFRIGGNIRYRDAALRVCEWVLGLQDPATGFFWANPAREHVFAHAHCYAAEGLLFAYHECGNREFLDAAILAAGALAGRQDPEGGIPAFPRDERSWHRRLRFARHPGLATDATAQAVDLWLFLDLLSGEARFQDNIERACRWLLSMQIRGDADPRARGAFRYRLEKNALGSAPPLHTWASQFSVRALIHFHQAREGSLTTAKWMELWT